MSDKKLTNNNFKWFKSINNQKEKFQMLVIYLGSLMIVIDETIVNVALPSIKNALFFTESNLTWVVNAYLLGFGGFLLIGGRMGDLFGNKKLFLFGIGIFTFSSFTSGIAQSQIFLIVSRSIQGLGGAIVTAVSLSEITILYPDNSQRTKAMGIFSFVIAGGGSIGVFMGGILTSMFGWYSIFLVNVPIGILVLIFGLMMLENDAASTKDKLDIWGSFFIMVSLFLAIYAVLQSDILEMVSLLVLTIVLMMAFIIVESKTESPLLPLNVITQSKVLLSCIIGTSWTIAMFAWSFLTALYMQNILGYSALQIGLAFLPTNIIMAFFSIKISSKLVFKYGIKRTIELGLLLVSIGLTFFFFTPISSNYIIGLLPGMLLIGTGAGISFNPVLMLAMEGVKTNQTGLTSGIVNTSFMMGGAFGLAIISRVSAKYTNYLVASGSNPFNALDNGYHIGYLVGVIFAFIALLVSIILLPNKGPLNKSKDKNKMDLIHSFYHGFQSMNRNLLESLFAKDFIFTSPNDKFDCKGFFENCFPNSSKFSKTTLESILLDKNEAMVRYYAELKNGKKFRNTEYILFENDKIRKIEVYFGSDY